MPNNEGLSQMTAPLDIERLRATHFSSIETRPPCVSVTPGDFVMLWPATGYVMYGWTGVFHPARLSGIAPLPPLRPIPALPEGYAIYRSLCNAIVTHTHFYVDQPSSGRLCKRCAKPERS